MTDETIRLADRYELGGLLGRGGMAEVRMARDLRLGRTVAIKQLRTELADDDTFHERFSREAQSAASLNHPSIVAVYDTGEALNDSGERIPYIVMEYVEGHTLREVLRDGRKILPERALSITGDVLKALDYSHRSGIIHRDIKPANVMLTPSGQVKVMDFGIARAVADASSAMTQTAAVIGTAQYLSPEQARGETVDARSDIYSTGCLLYELLTGRPPFVGDSPVSVAYQHVREEPRPASQLNPEVSASVDHVLAKALAKRVDERYQSAADMQADLQRVLDGFGVDAPTQLTPVVPAARLDPAPTAVTPAVTADQSPVGPPPRRSRRWLILVGLLLAICAGAAAWWLTSGPPAAPAQVEVPDVTGMAVDVATRALENKGFVVSDSVEERADAEIADGAVIETNPAMGSLADEHATVTLTVSTGPELVQIPNLVSLSYKGAASALTKLGLVPKQVTVESDRPKDEVLNTNPPAGTEVEPGSTVYVKVSAGTVPMPNVVGKSIEEATQILTQLGLVVKREKQDSLLGTDHEVTAQSIAEGEKVPRGTEVTLTFISLVVGGDPPPGNGNGDGDG